MPHEVSGADLVAYLEGALGVEQRGQVEAHLASCANCAREVEGLRLMRGLLEPLRCPSAEARAEALALGPATPDAAGVLAHMEQCAVCRRELEAVQEAVAMPVEPVPVRAALRAHFLARLPKSVRVSLAEMPVGRGATPLSRNVQLANVQIRLQFAGRYSGLAVAVRLQDSLSNPIGSVLVTAVSEDGKERFSGTTDARGRAIISFPRMHPGRYRLEVALPEPVFLPFELVA